MYAISFAPIRLGRFFFLSLVSFYSSRRTIWLRSIMARPVRASLRKISREHRTTQTLKSGDIVANTTHGTKRRPAAHKAAKNGQPDSRYKIPRMGIPGGTTRPSPTGLPLNGNSHTYFGRRR